MAGNGNDLFAGAVAVVEVEDVAEAIDVVPL